jgi:hypothetical protein
MRLVKMSIVNEKRKEGRSEESVVCVELHNGYLALQLMILQLPDGSDSADKIS